MSCVPCVFLGNGLFPFLACCTSFARTLTKGNEETTHLQQLLHPDMRTLVCSEPVSSELPVCCSIFVFLYDPLFVHLNWCSLMLHLSDMTFNFWGKSGQEEKVLSGTQDC